MSTQSAQTTALTALTAITAASWAIGLTLLVNGSLNADAAMLAWGTVISGAGTALGSLLVIHAMIQRAVSDCADLTSDAVQRGLDSAIATTAVQVGDAIAAALSDEDLAPARNGATRIY